MKIKQGTKIFITGAASGIGRSTAILMGEKGANLFLTDINENLLSETVDHIRQKGGMVSIHQACDIGNYEAVKKMADDIHPSHGPMDIVMNVAGITLFALIEDMTHDHWQKVINTNLWGPIHGIECFVTEMIRQKRPGHLVTVASLAGLAGIPWHVAYAATKWGCVGISEVLRYDLKQHNIGVTVICPGAVETPLKHSVEILKINERSSRIVNMKKRFSQHAVTAEKVAEQTFHAIEKNKFMVLTSPDIHILYFLKRKCYPVYHLILRMVSYQMNKMREN